MRDICLTWGLTWGLFLGLTVGVPGCATDALTPGAIGDGGPADSHIGAGEGGSGGSDLRTTVDLTGLSCTDVGTDIDKWLMSHASCQSDADCETIQTACGVQGQCGAFVNHDARGGYLDALVKSWNDHCNPPPCPCAPPFPQAGCDHGICNIKMTGSHPVGDPCGGGSDCQTGQCVTQLEAFGFVDGYCTVRQCDKNLPCPKGSDCKPVNGAFYCLKGCPINQMTCRMGYRCCSGPGPALGPGWCAPEQSTFCTAK